MSNAEFFLLLSAIYCAPNLSAGQRWFWSAFNLLVALAYSIFGGGGA